MFRRTAAAAALTAAGLVAAAPLASAAETAPAAHPRADGDGISDSGNVSVLPVNACGLQLPILAGILDAPDNHCHAASDAADDGTN